MSINKENFEQVLELVLKTSIQRLEVLAYDGWGFGNRISSEQATLLAKAISKNASLKQVIINYCDHFSSDAWKTILEALGNHPTLWHLDLDLNKIDSEIAKIIAVAVANSRTLHYLNLASNSLGPEGIAILADALINSQSLRELHLFSNSLEPRGARILSRIIAHSRIRSLDIASNQLRTRGMEAIVEGVSQSPHLQILNIGGNNLDLMGIKTIVDAVARSRSLEDLYMSANIKPSYILEEPEKLMAAISQALVSCRNLRTLSFSNNYLASFGGKAMATVITHSESLEDLDIGFCSLGCEGFRAIFTALRYSRNLRCLNVRSNIIKTSLMDEETMKEMVEGVNHCPSLSELNISGNELCNIHAKGIGEIIARNKNLKYLNLSDNQLAPLGIEYIANGLLTSSIQSLNMSNNGVAVLGAYHMARAIRCNQSLLDLDLSRCKLVATGVKEVIDAIPHSQTLQTLCMDGEFEESSCVGSKIPELYDGLARSKTLETLRIEDVPGHVLAKAVMQSRTLQKVICEFDERFQKIWDEMDTVLQQNQERQTILRSHWARVSTLIAFERANRDSFFRNSVLPLLPEILKMTGYYKLPK